VPMYYKPNEYFDVTRTLSGGNVNRYRDAWDRCKEKNLPNPPTVIGEFGLAQNFNPSKGWRSVQSLTDAKYAEMSLWHYQQWYERSQVAACIFSWSKWPIDKEDGYNAGDDRSFTDALEVYAAKVYSMPPELPQTKPLPDAPQSSQNGETPPTPVATPKPVESPQNGATEYVSKSTSPLQCLKAIRAELDKWIELMEKQELVKVR